MKQKLLILLFFAGSSLFGNESEKVQTEKIQGIVVLSDQECLLSESELASCQGVTIIGVRYGECLVKELLPFCQTSPLSQETIKQIQQQIERCYQTNGHPFLI